VFVAEGVRGQVTAVGRKESSQYAFYRGTSRVGPAMPPNAPAQASPPGKAGEAVDFDGDLGRNIKMQNYSNGMMQIQRLENRYKENRKGINVQEAK
jgi:hypothetical protein